MDIPLLTSQKNQVLQLIRTIGLDPYNFEWKEYVSERQDQDVVVPMLSYKGTNYFFIFDSYGSASFYSSFSPGRQRIEESDSTDSWERNMGIVRNWLVFLKRELAQPDLWEAMSLNSGGIDSAISPDEINAPFTYQEAVRIEKSIIELQEYLETQYSNPDELKAIHETLSYLADASKRQGRKDWYHTCVGTLLGMATQLAMDPDKVRQMWGIIKTGILGAIRLLAS